MEKSLSKKPNSYKKINKSVENMNSLPSGKDKQTPNEAEKDSLNLERNRERFNFLRLKKLEKKKLDKNFWEKTIKVRVFTWGGRRSTSACFMAKETRF